MLLTQLAPGAREKQGPHIHTRVLHGLAGKKVEDAAVSSHRDTRGRGALADEGRLGPPTARLYPTTSLHSDISRVLPQTL